MWSNIERQMKIKPSSNPQQWPRRAVESVECRKRYLVIRITDWTRDKDEPAYDVECYIGGIYDFNESQVFSTKDGGKQSAKARAIAFASAQTQKLL